MYKCDIMNVVQNFMERLRPIVGLKGWDYCVVWKLADDQRYLEWVDCCCGGTEDVKTGGEELQFPVSSTFPCRDFTLQHSRTKCCELLAQLPSSMPLESGIHTQALMSNQPRWLNYSNSAEPNALDETTGTRALIPFPGGLVELFVAKQVPEDQNVIDFVASQCNFLIVDHEASVNATNMDFIFSSEHQSKPFMTEDGEHRDRISHFQSPASPATALENMDYPYDVNGDRIGICNSLGTGLENLDMQFMECLANKHQQQQGNDKDSMKQLDNGRSDSIPDCSDQDDTEDDAKYRRRTGERPHSKNLHAERKRRKRLNERLYDLRALVPNISKLNKAAILGDAIEFVKELQKQVKELQDELEEGVNNSHQNNISEVSNQNGGNMYPRSDVAVNGFHLGASSSSNITKLSQDSEITHDKGQQMEPQVDVAQMDGNEFFVKVFCEHKPGGFARLMEALESLGLEVANVNVTSFRTLVSNIFIVKKRDSEMVQVDYVKDSLLEITRNHSGGWPEMATAPENCSTMDTVDYQHHMQNGHISSNHRHRHHFHS
ncbi:hypothetical protein K2173_010576 [Erythroxylum novogranatense]|uniref:BHLH domain-containing protein n=1 Tax=Erythroxylum novogranatense TaxID=1862640 RepID=A0AAV8TGC4_9ROSI|nr:hypothetical protein K2173_010576 [Erythroxylum novogranatense]